MGLAFLVFFDDKSFLKKNQIKLRQKNCKGHENFEDKMQRLKVLVFGLIMFDILHFSYITCEEVFCRSF